MRRLQYLVFCLLIMSSAVCFAQKEDWLPITPQDLQYKEVPGNPGAPAVRLYYAHHIDENAFSEFIYERIKILNEKAIQATGNGKTYAEVEIPVLTDEGLFVTITDLKARTIRPDGSIVEFTGKPFEKILYKGRGNKVAVKVLSMPEVTVGSIVEYKYKYSFQAAWYSQFIVFSSGEWVMQSELFTVKEYFFYRPYEGGVYQSHTQASFYWDGAQVSRVAFNLKEKPKAKGNEVELELDNVPGFEEESYMPPDNNFKPSVRFFYSRRGVGNTDNEWQDIAKTQYERVETFIGKNHGVKEAAIEATNGETEPGLKLRKLYQRAQQVRNLTYERERTAEERKKENIIKNDGSGDVLAHGYGTDREITELFVAMARAAGFDAWIVQVSDRKKRFFSKDWTSLQQIDSQLALVNFNGTDMYLDPGTRFCPYGSLHWNHTATDGLKLDKKGGTFIKAPAEGFEKSSLRRTGFLSIGEDGGLKGAVTLEMKGQEALEHRLDGIDSDEAGKKKQLEDELKSWLPAGAIVKMIDVKGWEESDDPLVANFNIEVPSFASSAGKLLLVPAYLFQVRQNRAFVHAQRKYPVYFPYAFTENDAITVKIPSGFTVETVPQQQDAKLPYARYQNLTQFDGTQIFTQRRLAVNGVFFPLERYGELKDFFGKVQAGDEQQAVLRGGSSNAQKGN